LLLNVTPSSFFLAYFVSCLPASPTVLIIFGPPTQALSFLLLIRDRIVPTVPTRRFFLFQRASKLSLDQNATHVPCSPVTAQGVDVLISTASFSEPLFFFVGLLPVLEAFVTWRAALRPDLTYPLPALVPRFTSISFCSFFRLFSLDQFFLMVQDTFFIFLPLSFFLQSNPSRFTLSFFPSGTTWPVRLFSSDSEPPLVKLSGRLVRACFVAPGLRSKCSPTFSPLAVFSSLLFTTCWDRLSSVILVFDRQQQRPSPPLFSRFWHFLFLAQPSFLFSSDLSIRSRDE